MSDIFLSYNREDQAAARRFAEAFEAHGLSVWWDVTLRSGEAYDQVTEKALRDAKAVVVLWSKKSVESRWVRAEATLAERYKTLVPAMIEPCDRPIMFELTQTAELSHWQGDAMDAAWLAFLRDVRRFVENKGPVATGSAALPTPLLTQPTDISIAVLPFANMSGDPEQEYFSDGISEDIITDLSRVSALSVISRNSSFTFKGKHVDLPRVARQLQVTHVLEGSVRKSGNRVRITAQLIDGANNKHIWAERYDRDLSDIFALQDEISQAIVAALKVKLFPEEKKAIENAGTANLEAYDTYLRAEALGRQGDLSEQAARLYRDALAIDPNFAEARAGLVNLYGTRLVFMPGDREQTLQKLDETVRDALARSPSHWASHLAHGTLLAARQDLLGTAAAFTKMQSLAPRSATIAPVFFGLFASGVGRNTEAVRAEEEARLADPLSLLVSTQLVQDLYIAGRTSDAEFEYARTLDLQGNREPLEHIALFIAWDSGDKARTKLQFRRFLDTQIFPLPVLHELFAVFDRPADALALIRSAFNDSAYQGSTQMMLLSWYAGRFGDTELAIGALRRCYLEMNGSYVKPIWYPVLRETRKTPAFKQFVRDLGIYAYWRASGQWGDFARPLGEDDFEIYR
ncbi:MAG: TIR domain-containing protein [Gammaproteobacteria bacterium]